MLFKYVNKKIPFVSFIDKCPYILYNFFTIIIQGDKHMINLKSEINNYLINCTSQKNLSSHTLKAYRIDLTQFLLFKENMSLSKSNLTEYIQELHTKYKPKTVKRKIASLKAFVHYLYFEDLIESNPFDKIDTTFKEPVIVATNNSRTYNTTTFKSFL